MKQSTQRIFFTALAVIFLLAACAPAQVATPDPAEIENQIATSVALTVASQNLETQQAAPVATNTAPTDTCCHRHADSVCQQPRRLSSSANSAPVVVDGCSSDYSSTSPVAVYDYQVFKPDDEFDVRWTIINTAEGQCCGLDLKYSIGERLHRAVWNYRSWSRGRLTVEFDAVAPSRPGNYIDLHCGRRSVLSITITVERP
jgi:hypothetical protein